MKPNAGHDVPWILFDRRADRYNLIKLNSAPHSHGYGNTEHRIHHFLDLPHHERKSVLQATFHCFSDRGDILEAYRSFFSRQQAEEMLAVKVYYSTTLNVQKLNWRTVSSEQLYCASFITISRGNVRFLKLMAEFSRILSKLSTRIFILPLKRLDRTATFELRTRSTN